MIPYKFRKYQIPTYRFHSLNRTNPLNGASYYRLKITDKDGKYVYSKILGVNAATAQSISFTLYPNPNSGKETTWLKIENSKGISAVSTA